MSLGEQNRYWWDVLENGTNSRYASFFDIDWNSSEERLRDKVLVPVLGGPVWAGVERGRRGGEAARGAVHGGGGGAVVSGVAGEPVA